MGSLGYGGETLEDETACGERGHGTLSWQTYGEESNLEADLAAPKTREAMWVGDEFPS